MSKRKAKVDAVTRRWIRNPSDEMAARNGCRFDEQRGAFTVWWIERICKLYEGDQAGEPMILRGCHKCGDYGLWVPDEWDQGGIAVCLERARLHAECVAAGHPIDWQYDVTMRVFGWVKWSEHWKEEIRRFRRAKVYISKKNKKSPTLAAWALYKTAGDGEPGNHVNLTAKDGSQAREIAGTHLVEMVRQSEELRAECTINLTKMQVTHEPSRSNCRPLSSSNARTQKSKEGLNGDTFTDETHVVDRAFMDRITRAGISRKEPLAAEFSTAGDDPDSYGKEQFDRCEKILSGEIEDEQTFAAIYAAPQNLTDAQLAADPLKYGRMANPAMGHTVDPAEFLADYNTSKQAPGTLATFKMYRLNIWQNAASPWLPMDRYDAGEQSFTHESMQGRECWSALDLSAVSDFSSLSLVFPEAEESHRYLWWFWLPEETARAVQHKMPIRQWEADPRCRLILTPGSRIHYGAIRSTFRQLAKEYQINELSYDDWNAEQTSQEISEGVTDHSGRVIEPATGIPRVNFSQALKAMNEPTKRFEGAVKSGQVIHNGDPIARWMMRNATIKPDVNGNYKPLKSADLLKKIDGVITAIMARYRAELGFSGGGWFYEDNDVELV